MKTIKLNGKFKDKFAIVDDEDFEELNKFKWFAVEGKQTFYANRGTSRKEDLYKVHKMNHILMHRQILGLLKSKPLVDHKNRNGLDNTRNNIRIATNSQNGANAYRKCGTSKYTGVSWFKRDNKWKASISKNYKAKHIGLYNTEEEAAMAYNKEAVKVHGDFAKINIIS